jgi:hypothetical protein
MTEWRPPEGWTVEPKRDSWVIIPPDGYGDPITLLWADYPTDCGLIAATRATIEARLREVGNR